MIALYLVAILFGALLLLGAYTAAEWGEDSAGLAGACAGGGCVLWGVNGLLY